eukprot:CAMPEP_0119109164 /NCGR_PEP_ID=MMETSP1180-20130426/17495_1 /TAXON_ID=3052 ORGANISM="Chlamydomonas cf sp, Strain CCMP681" /NCGR_SAMPLE_ID=MMETSP1180 /ASSEMBLY_ACC=CAM_ASM_000741 /LENGTH=191 /DNA_ID=CAMNT_0007094881 /DNA_START=38 /DNA_END=613 /DNA_ORIENTATION=+
MAKLHIHPVGLILLLLALACWVVMLGGLAASISFCKNNSNPLDTIISCSQTYQQDWWTLFFELFLILVMLATCFLNIFPKARYVYLAYLSMTTALLTWTTRKFFTESFNQGWLSLDNTSRAYDAAAVGAMLLCIVNFSLIIFVGLGAAKELAPEGGGFNSLPVNGGPPTGMGSLQMTHADGRPMQPPPATF